MLCIDEGPTPSLYERALSLLSEENELARAQVAWAQLIRSYVSSVNDALAAVESGLQGGKLAQEAERAGSGSQFNEYHGLSDDRSGALTRGTPA